MLAVILEVTQEQCSAELITKATHPFPVCLDFVGYDSVYCAAGIHSRMGKRLGRGRNYTSCIKCRTSAYRYADNKENQLFHCLKLLPCLMSTRSNDRVDQLRRAYASQRSGRRSFE